MRLALFVPAFFVVLSIHAQSVQPKEHISEAAPVLVAFTNATVHIDARTVIQKATMVVMDGKVVAVGEKVKPPAGAVIRDLKGQHIWPSLIDPYSDLGLPASTSDERKVEWKGARHWNGALRADARAHIFLKSDEKKSGELRKAGFGVVYTHRMDGIARGTSAAVMLDDGDLRRSVIRPDLAAHFSFRKGSSPDAYPTSHMGAIALIRQAFLDAQWVAGLAQHDESDAVLAAIADQIKGRMVFDAQGRNEVLRWAKVLDEFKLPGIIKGSGDEYARLQQIKQIGLPMIVPVDLPEAYDVRDPFDALEVSYARLKHWEFAPFNPMMLDTAGVAFALTTHGRQDLKELWRDIRRMVQCGLDSARAIEAFTTDPARFFAMDDRIGALRPGMLANFLITSGHLLDEKNVIHENWIGKKRFVLIDLDKPKLAGIYDLNLGGTSIILEVSEKEEKLEAFVRRPSDPDTSKWKAAIERQGSIITVSFATKEDPSAVTRLSGTIHREGLWDGQGQKPGGKWFSWSAIRQASKTKGEARSATSLPLVPVIGPLHFPLNGHGWTEPPPRSATIFRNATVWTGGTAGILRNTDVLVHEGRIKAIGEKLDAGSFFPGRNKPVVMEIDAKGLHLTAGIVDEHSHIAISRGVNEVGHHISSEVRLGDVIDPDDVNIYRALAGGVTTVQLLHGSANAIGGQSALIKLKWGLPADSMLIKNAPKHIKFALGENVKQSNWGQSSRFPQTRMGVEQLYYDAFARAAEADRDQQAWSSLRPKERERNVQPRRDLRSEALQEILRGDRNITCHSYLQSEIDMLMHVADSVGFKVNTFTHILEGYKMAGKMKRHGVNASTFSDWWAYKLEVYDAIPYNAALLYRSGVRTGINSDDAEMCRRLNQEAAKTIKYGGVPLEEALRMITLNPSAMLKLDHRIGSIEVGKDADLVLWSTDPLSISARVLRTYVEGVCYYSVEEDAAQRQLMAEERDRLVRAMLSAGEVNKKKPERDVEHQWHCDDIGEGDDAR